MRLCKIDDDDFSKVGEKWQVDNFKLICHGLVDEPSEAMREEIRLYKLNASYSQTAHSKLTNFSIYRAFIQRSPRCSII